MNAKWFDTLTTSVSQSGSRRRVMRLGTALPLAGAAGRLFGTSFAGADKVSAENCTPEGKRCGKGKRRQPCKKCCTGNVITDQKGKRRCSCVRLGSDCRNDSQCCEGICDAGTCQTSDPGPDPVPCTGLKPTATGATKGLQEAIDAADPGDTLTLCGETWNLTETVNIDKALTLIGAGVGQTILDGGNDVGVLLIDTFPVMNAPVTLQDLTITKGNAPFGAGIINYNDESLTLRRVSVTNNTATNPANAGLGGGGIFNKGVVTLDEGSRVTGNTAALGGGIHNDLGTVTLEGPDPSPIVVNNCQDNCAGTTVAKCVATPVSCS